MITAKNSLAALALGLAVTAFASSSFAQEGGVRISAARAAAIHECSVKASRYSEYAWGNTEIYVYDACMAEHGQEN
jgi:hypothetical protein